MLAGFCIRLIMVSVCVPHEKVKYARVGELQNTVIVLRSGLEKLLAVSIVYFPPKERVNCHDQIPTDFVITYSTHRQMRRNFLVSLYRLVLKDALGKAKLKLDTRDSCWVNHLQF